MSRLSYAFERLGHAVVLQNNLLEVKALIANQDIGFVDVEQPAPVKVATFPFTRYGTIGQSAAVPENSSATLSTSGMRPN